MNREARVLCISILLLFSLLFQNPTTAEDKVENEEKEYYIKSTVTFSNKGTKVLNFTEREEYRAISLFMNNSWQTVYLVNSTYPIETVKSNEDGNLIAVLQFPKMLLFPGQNISYTVTYRIVSKPRTIDDINETVAGSLNEIPKAMKEKYLTSEGPWLLDNAELQSLAYNITGNESNVLTITKNFVDWITKNIEYAQVHETPLYPNETLSERKGDCDDQAILLTALLRIRGIPAFVQIGALYTPSRVNSSSKYWDGHLIITQKRIGWHGWTMVYIPPWGWLPVDLTFILGGMEEKPLNAIKKAAITYQGTIQYMNISRADYIATSRNMMLFLQTNSFYVYQIEEMIEVERYGSPFGVNMGKSISAIALIVTFGLLIVSSYQITKRWGRKREKESLKELKRNVFSVKCTVSKRILNK